MCLILAVCLQLCSINQKDLPRWYNQQYNNPKEWNVLHVFNIDTILYLTPKGQRVTVHLPIASPPAHSFPTSFFSMQACAPKVAPGPHMCKQISSRRREARPATVSTVSAPARRRKKSSLERTGARTWKHHQRVGQQLELRSCESSVNTARTQTHTPKFVYLSEDSQIWCGPLTFSLKLKSTLNQQPLKVLNTSQLIPTLLVKPMPIHTHTHTHSPGI